MRGRTLQRRASLALVLGLAFATGPLATPAQASCVEFTMYATWNGTDPTGQSSTVVHDGCVTDGVGDGSVSFGDDFDGPVPPGLPNGLYVYLSVPIP